MAIEATRSMYCLWTGYFQDNSRKHVAMVTEDKSVDSILTISEQALKPYTKLSSHIAKLSKTQERRNVFKTDKKRTVSQYRQYCATALNAHFEQVSIKRLPNSLCITDYS